VQYPYLRCFILMTSCKTEKRLLVEWGKLTVVAAFSQWRCRLSACVRLTVDIFSTFYGVFMVQCVELMLRMSEFWVFTVLFIAIYNLSETFTRYWYYTVELEDIIVIGRLFSCLLNRCACKLEKFNTSFINRTYVYAVT